MIVNLITGFEVEKMPNNERGYFKEPFNTHINNGGNIPLTDTQNINV